VDVDGGEPLLAELGQREAVGQEDALALLAAGEGGAGVDGLGRRRWVAVAAAAAEASAVPAAAEVGRRGGGAAGGAHRLVDQLLPQSEPVGHEAHELVA